MLLFKLSLFIQKNMHFYLFSHIALFSGLIFHFRLLFHRALPYAESIAHVGADVIETGNDNKIP
jgi:hypothetical protein